MYRTSEVVLLVRYSINRMYYRIICIIRDLQVVTIDTWQSSQISVNLLFHNCRYLII
nr:MAG TPA: hypothetical protein [Caudoviricetes sp.]